MTKHIFLTLDIEEFDIPLEYGQQIPLSEQIEVSSQGLIALLDRFDLLNIKFTGFTTGVFAEQRPDLIHRMVQSGHEIASHGYSHNSFSLDDLSKSKKILEDISQTKITGFRRPRFAPTDPEAILAAGYQYDSSENPIWLPGRYNGWKNPRLHYNKGALKIIPASASPGIRFPLFWLAFKNFPQGITRFFSSHTLSHDGHLNLLFHPWEFTNLAPYQLPHYVRNPDGETYLDLLCKHLQWLKSKGDFLTMNHFVE